MICTWGLKRAFGQGCVNSSERHKIMLCSVHLFICWKEKRGILSIGTRSNMFWSTAIYDNPSPASNTQYAKNNTNPWYLRRYYPMQITTDISHSLSYTKLHSSCQLKAELCKTYNIQFPVYWAIQDIQVLREPSQSLKKLYSKLNSSSTTHDSYTDFKANIWNKMLWTPNSTP